MNGHVKAWLRPMAATLAVTTGLAVPAAAATPPPAPTPSNTTPMAAAVVRAAAVAPATALAQTATAAPAASDSPGGFFSTSKGKLAVALFVGGVAWTIYTFGDSRDPVKSPIR